MDIEMVDIVDQQNRVIGQTSKDEAHEKGLLHRTIIAEVINRKGETLLVKQAGHKQDAGQYVSPVGGHVKAGETEEEALKREALEEVGLTNFKFKRVGQIIYNRYVVGRQENHFFIVYEIYCDDTPTLNEESVHYEWFTKERLKEETGKDPKKFGDAFYIVFREFYAHWIS
jgi:8-oxo-dGTP pyrophosphatase MutT (NUDIX family)